MADLPATLPALPHGRTPPGWPPLAIPRAAYLDEVEALVRFAVQHQSESGAIVDPLLDREHQYSTPYFAFAAGALLHEGRAQDLHDAAVRAMDHSTGSFAQGADGIPDRHGEFYIAPLVGALELYDHLVPQSTIERWRERLRTPIYEVIDGPQEHRNNWRTYAMKGEWLRAQAGLADRDETHEFIRYAWFHASQRERILYDKWNLYEDWSSDPNPHGVEAVGRGNLTALIAHGYDGELAPLLSKLVERGAQVSLLLQSPDGQCPPNGRTDNHVWNDILYQLIFEVMAERHWARGDKRLAGQYRRAAMLAFRSALRWKRTDPPWDGFFSITKNFFPPADRVGHQPASQVGNYSGAVMYHLAEAYLARRTEIPEVPAPTEIGGYAFETDQAFSSVVANAGGMQVFANLRGDAWPKYDLHWSALGVVRFAKAGWDSRLGPSDGVFDLARGLGVTFAPTWKENGEWLRMAEQHARYEADFEGVSAAPDRVVFRLSYAPKTSGDGPKFVHELTVTPDQVECRLTAEGAEELGVTWPLLENDGRPLEVDIGDRQATVRYPGGEDIQTYEAPQRGARLVREEVRVQSAYGWLRPVRAEAVDGVQVTIVRPGP